MTDTRFHLRTRPRMYTVVFFVCGVTALLVEYLVTSTADFRTYTDRQLQSAISQAADGADLSQEAPESP